MASGKSEKSLFRRIFEIVAVIAVIFIVLSVLLPSLSSSRKSRFMHTIQKAVDFNEVANVNYPNASQAGEPKQIIAGKEAASVPFAQVKTFIADINLTPKLSVGTALPESIYEAAFRANLEIVCPKSEKGMCQIRLPLPPQIISLSDLNVIVNGDPSNDVSVDPSTGVLVWCGTIDMEKTAKMEVTYTAVGKGIYNLQTPPGKIIDTFEATLVANKSDIRMMQLSLQPQELKKESGKTTYIWKYKRLMFGRPIVVDVLGVAPMDQLGELTWLGPTSLLFAGLVVTMIILAFRPAAMNKWMLLLIIGTFAGAYPLMYFAQEYMSLSLAVGLSAGLILLIIAIRAVTLLGIRLGLFGVTLATGAIMAIFLAATIYPSMQGILITAAIIGTFVLTMCLLPKVLANLKAIAAAAAPVPPPFKGTE